MCKEESSQIMYNGAFKLVLRYFLVFGDAQTHCGGFDNMTLEMRLERTYTILYNSSCLVYS